MLSRLLVRNFSPTMDGRWTGDQSLSLNLYIVTRIYFSFLLLVHSEWFLQWLHVNVHPLAWFLK